MSLPIRTGVAPLGRPRLTAAELAAQRIGQPAPGGITAPDPRGDIMQAIQEMPTQVPSPDVERGIPVMEGFQEIQSEQDIADLGGGDFPPAAQVVPEVDEENNPIIDPATGQPVMRKLEPEDYNQELLAQRMGHFSTQGPVQAISQNPVQGGRQALTDLFEAEQMAADNPWSVSARDAAKIENRAPTTKQYIETAATELATVVMTAQEALFDWGTKALINVDGTNVPVGFKVMADSGINDPQVEQVASTISGIALMQAVGQMGVYRPAPGGDDTGQLDTQESMGNIINAVRHGIVNGMTRNGVKLADGGADALAQAVVLHYVNNGQFMPSKSSDGKAVLEPTEDFRRQAAHMQRVAEAITGDTKRKAASSTPTHSGSGFHAGRPKMTKGAPTTLKYSRKAADLTKSILGAVGQVFRAKDLKRKEYEVSQVFSPEFVERDKDGNFLYSVHPFAKRLEVHKGAYLTAQNNVSRHTKFDANNPRHEAEFNKIRLEEAAKVMAEKEATIMFDMANAKKTKGVVFSEWIHSPSNQRFYPNSYNTDYMGSKSVIRDVMGLAGQDTVRADSLFDPKEIARLKERAANALTGGGRAIADKLEGLTPNDLGAIGAMHNAVMYYYSALDNSVKNVTKMPVLDAIRLYTPEIGARLAGIGQKYNEFMSDTANVVPDTEMMGLWAATEKGEALGSINLWDDFFKAKTMFDLPASSKHSFMLTHHSIDDGNQNGIFLQALFFGLKDASATGDAVTRLAVADPTMADMRVFGMDKMVHYLKEMVSDDPIKEAAWRNFWAEAIGNDMDQVAKDFFKKPLMQNAYGKDAGMFNDVLMSMMEDNERYSALARKHLLDTGAYKDIVEAGQALTDAVELSLRQVIDSRSVNMMKNIGRLAGVMNLPFVLQGITGDDLVITPVGAAPVSKAGGDAGRIGRVQLADGSWALLKSPSYEGNTLINADTGEEVNIPVFRQQPIPAATKGTQRFWNRREQRYDEYNNPLGTKIARQFAVLMIQAMDGDMVKQTAIHVNRNRMNRRDKPNAPRPVLFVHDSIISTPGSSLLYVNAYNNISIPESIPKIAEMGKKIQEFIHKAEAQEKHKVVTRGEPVGIGANGEYAGMGALFDEFYDKIQEVGKPSDYVDGSKTMPNDYKARFLKRTRAQAKARKGSKGAYSATKRFEQRAMSEEKEFGDSPEAQWDKYKTRIQSVLADARKHGWRPAQEMQPKDVPNLAIDAKDFPAMLDLSAELLNLTSTFKPWTEDFSRRVMNAHKRLMQMTKVGGIRQMSSSGGVRSKGYEPVPIDRKSPIDTPPTIPEVSPGVLKPLDHLFDTEPPF